MDWNAAIEKNREALKCRVAFFYPRLPVRSAFNFSIRFPLGAPSTSRRQRRAAHLGARLHCAVSIVPRRPPAHDNLVDAARLGRRFAALAAALDDLPAQARRFARWRARNDAIIAQSRNRDAAAANRRNPPSPLSPG